MRRILLSLLILPIFILFAINCGKKITTSPTGPAPAFVPGDATATQTPTPIPSGTPTVTPTQTGCAIFAVLSYPLAIPNVSAGSTVVGYSLSTDDFVETSCHGTKFCTALSFSANLTGNLATQILAAKLYQGDPSGPTGNAIATAAFNASGFTFNVSPLGPYGYFYVEYVTSGTASGTITTRYVSMDGYGSSGFMPYYPPTRNPPDPTLTIGVSPGTPVPTLTSTMTLTPMPTATFTLTPMPTVISTCVVTTFAGSGTPGAGDGTGASSSFLSPVGIAVDSAGNVYVGDSGNRRVRVITPGGVVSTLAGSGAGGSDDGPAATATFYDLMGVAVDSSGAVYVADHWNHTIRKIYGGTVSTLAGLAGSYGYVDGTRSAARFYAPEDVAVDASGNVYVADGHNERIRKITPAGVVTTFAGTGDITVMNNPSSLAVDAEGNVYVTDMYNNRILKITPSGTVSTLAGGTAGFRDGMGAAASFYEPTGITVDLSGNVYVSDSLNHRIRKITPTGWVTTLAGSGIRGFADGIGTAANFNWPMGIGWGPSNALYVGDTDNNLIRKIQQ